MHLTEISALIDKSPTNRGISGPLWLLNPDNVAISIGDNVFLFQIGSDGLAEFHWLSTGTKGRQAIRDTQDAMRQIFEQHEIEAIYGLVSVDRRDSAFMARWIGAKYCGDVQTRCGRCQLFLITPEILKGAGN